MLHGTIALTERLGAETVVDGTIKDGTTIIAAPPEDIVLTPGTKIGLRFDPARAHLFRHEETWNAHRSVRRPSALSIPACLAVAVEWIAAFLLIGGRAATALFHAAPPRIDHLATGR